MEENAPFQGNLDNEGNNYENQGNNQVSLLNQEFSPDSPALVKMQIFMMISIFSWVLLLITGWIFLAVPNIEGLKIFWIYYIYYTTNDEIDDFPLTIHYVLFFLIALVTLLCITVALVIYLYSLFIKKDFLVIRAMIGNLSKFHFIPLFCVSSLFIIGETCKDEIFNDGQYIFHLFFSFIALGSLIFIYTQTKLEKPLYAVWAIKHGSYSCLVALLIHNIGYSISAYGTQLGYNKGKFDEEEDLYNWLKGCYITFSIIIGLGNNCVAFFLKEFVIVLINLLIYIGMTIQFYRINEEQRKKNYGKAPGIIDIIMIVPSACMTGFLVYKKFISA